MSNRRKVVAVIPVKETTSAKQRLHAALRPGQRRELALAMLEDVLKTVTEVRGLAGVVVATADTAAAVLGRRNGTEIWADEVDVSHSAAVAAAARRLARDGLAMLTLPADIPLVQGEDIGCVLAAHAATSRKSRTLVIVPARDERGSNAVLCSPADAVMLRFGNDSFFPHLAQAKACGIEPHVARLPRIALDIDTPDDLALLMATDGHTRSQTLLRRWQDCGTLTLRDTAARHRGRRSSA
jgi:2-phospho-L-lactate guanylyltransferase